MDSNGIMVPRPGDPSSSSKRLPPPPPSFDPKQQFLHPPPSPDYVNTDNADILIGLLNDDRSTSSQAINNTYAPSRMSIQKLTAQNLGLGGPLDEPQTGATCDYASSENDADSQQQQFPSNHPQFLQLLDYFKKST
jgi:hypothetical protein